MIFRGLKIQIIFKSETLIIVSYRLKSLYLHRLKTQKNEI